MRQWTAILILVLFGGFYAAPLIAAASSDPEANLPACCRRHGKHHCAMMDAYLQATSPGSPQVSATPQHCPFYPHGVPPGSLTLHAAPPPAAAHFAQLVSQPAIQAQTQALYCLSLDRARQKRGPPALSSRL
jgi:hypothetical protein